MFIHNFKYAFKTLFKNKVLIFWTFAFPIILGTFFYMAFSDIEENEKLDVFAICLVEDVISEQNTMFKEAFESLSEEGENQLFDIDYVDIDEAKALLRDKDIEGYVVLQEGVPTVVVGENGINETILQFVVNEMIEKNILMKDYFQYKPDEMMSFLEKVQSFAVNIKDVSNQNMSYTMIEYYTLIAMVCLYGGTLSLHAMNQNLANMSNKGKRISVCPNSKGILILSSLLASFVIQLIGLGLLFFYLICFLHVDFGDRFFFIFLLAIVGSLAGLSLGVIISSTIKQNEDVKTGIVIAFTMLGSFLSGMMGITMKYIIDKNVPIINYLNPVNMITDGFYSLYYYDSLNRYWFNVISLFLFTGGMLIISVLFLRRQKYDSI